MTLKSELQVTQFYPKWYHSKAWVRFPIRLSNYGSILHRFRDKAGYWSQIVIFIPLAFGAPVRGSMAEYCHPVWCGKLEWWGYPMVKKI